MSRTPVGSSSQTVSSLAVGRAIRRRTLVFAQLSGHGTPRRSSSGFDFSSRPHWPTGRAELVHSPTRISREPAAACRRSPAIPTSCAARSASRTSGSTTRACSTRPSSRPWSPRRARCWWSPAPAAARRARSSSASPAWSSRASTRSAILLLTFTRKAAEEMLRRAAGLLDGRCEQVAGGTFHSFANLVLRRYGARRSAWRARSPSSTAATPRTSSACCAPRMGLDKKDKRFPRKQTIAEMFSMAVNKSRPLRELIEARYGHLAEHADDLAALGGRVPRLQGRAPAGRLRRPAGQAARAAARPRVGAHRSSRSATATSWSTSTRTPTRCRRRSCALLAATHDNVMAVGDDAQSIYAFRGANFRNIMDFPTLFPGTRVITLEENYRSTQPILDLANAIIAQATRALHEDAVHPPAGAARSRCWSRPRTRTTSRASSASASSSCARRACRCRRSPCSSARASTPSISSSS